MAIQINIHFVNGLKIIGVNMKAVVVIGKNYSFNNDDFKNAYVIGVDKGALLCLKNEIKMDIAIGDFDSITQDELDLLYKETEVIRLNPIKDETDTCEALEYCNGYDDITILGGIMGNRIEHFYANLLLLENYPNIKIKDDNSLIFTASNDITLKKSIYKYVSIFSLSDNTILSLSGFKYDLDSYHMNRLNPLGVSNEILNENALINIKNGKILIILSKDDNK